MRNSTVLALPACLLMAGCGVGQSAQTIVAHKIADALPSTLGPARHYDVKVSGSVLGLARGEARQVLITGQDVQLGPALAVDTLNLDARDIAFDIKSRQVRRIGSAEYVASIGQAHLTQYLAQTQPSLRVTLGASDMVATLPVSAGPLHTSVAVRGTLVPIVPGASTLKFVADAGQIGILPVPAFAVNAALELVNPVLDLSRARVPIGVQSVAVEQGQLTLRGTAQLALLEQPR